MTPRTMVTSLTMTPQVTSLTTAAKLQLGPVALLLLEEGADPNIPCRGKTAAGTS